VVMKSSILWNITPCSLLKDGGNMFFCDAGWLSIDYMVLYPGR
jgi:hypothetical protein